MKLQTVPARQGALWVRNGFQAFFARPMAFAGLFATLMFTLLVMMVIPLVGPLVFLVALPMVSMGFILATQASLQGKFPLPTVLIEPLRAGGARRTAMIRLGVAYAVAALAGMLLSDLFDGGKLAELQKAMVSQDITPEARAALAADPQLRLGILLRFALMALLSLPFWHAPALIHWDGQPWGKAIFFSTLACWRNKAAFLVYGLTWLAVLMLFSLLLAGVSTLLGSPQLMVLAALPAGLMFSTVFYVSLYFTFTDCFTQDAPPAEAIPGT
jgi:hypothetical protein